MGIIQLKIVVVSHDAGSSEILCSLIAYHVNDVSWTILALPNSPMARICARHHFTFIPIEDATVQLSEIAPDALFFGTGWQERVEQPFVQYCKQHSIPTFSFLDHWSNYRERFGYPAKGWETNCGDFTLLSDGKALQIAQEYNLPNPKALRNYYLYELIQHSKSTIIEPNQNLLFLSEPTDAVALKAYGDANFWGFTQYSALVDILEHFALFECSGLTIRLHPSDNGDGYAKILEKYSHIPIVINNATEIDLIQQLLEAKIVIGFDTMALYTAALMGKKIISYLPSSNREFLLPLPAIYQIRSLTILKSSNLPAPSITIDNFGMDFALFLETIMSKG